MADSFSANLNGLQELVGRFNDPALIQEINKIPQNKGVVAIIAQAIADNFAKEGPGWKALKMQTIRQSIPKAMRKKMKNLTMAEHQEREEIIARHNSGQSLSNHDIQRVTSLNAKAKIKNMKSLQPSRKILQRTGLLKKSVTTPGAQGNINRTEGTNLVWGTNLVYAGIHNSGGTLKHPGTKNGFGMGIKIPAHDIPIPKREYLVIRDEWKSRLNDFIVEKCLETIKKYLGGKGR